MSDAPPGLQNPISAAPGAVQTNVDPVHLRPSRTDLSASRLKLQHYLLGSGQHRHSLISVSEEGVIIDGHHAIRAAAEQGRNVDVFVSSLKVPAQSGTILDLPIR